MVTQLTYETIAAAISATVDEAFVPRGPVGRISTDSRTTTAGDLYIALTGRSTDGHRFVPQVLLEQHAAAALVARSAFEAGGALAGQREVYAGRVLEVDSTLDAYQAIARTHRLAYDLPVIAITGSNGKTSTKDLLAALLATHFEGTLGRTVLKTWANENNEFGVPKTLLGITGATGAAVIEMGMRGPEEIRPLARAASPTVGLITCIGEAHLERLGSRRAIADAKGELIEELGPNAVAVLPRDSDWYEHLATKARCRVVSFGWHEAADVRVADASPIGLTATRVTLAPSAALGTTTPLVLVLPMAGLHNATNLAAAVAAAVLSGVPVPGLEGLGAFHESSGRRLEAQQTPSGTTIFNDVYNASPASVEAALATLAALPVVGRRAAVLGDMFELGPEEAAMHARVGELAAQVVDLLVTVGRLSEHSHRAATQVAHARCVHTTSAAEAAHTIARWAGPEDVVLVKASRGMQLDEVVQRLCCPEEVDVHG